MSACWVVEANAVECDFPIENLPYGAFAAPGGEVHLGVAIGEQILDLHAAERAGLLAKLTEPLRTACREPVLNALMALGAGAQPLRRRLQALLASTDGNERERAGRTLVAQAEAHMRLPVAIGDYTDFYASIHHATNVGSLFRPDNPLLANYKYLPVGYHGRSSSIIASPQAVWRPRGQRPGKEGKPPDFGPSRQLDYELEVGAFISRGNEMGQPVPLTEAEDHIFGFCLLNDWSARDVQRWEYQPLGPFLGKNFATSISPWVVAREALAPYRVARAPRPAGDPEPLPHLEAPGDREGGALDVTLEVWLTSLAMREHDLDPVRLSRGNLRELYWTMGQMVAHHTSGGCNLRSGDLLGTGTVSGPAPEARGCLLELTRAGREPLRLPSGETRTFLEDGDEVVLRAWCQRPGQPRIGWGECRGLVRPALRAGQ